MLNRERLRLHPDFNPHAFGHCVIFSGKIVTAPQIRRCPYAYVLCCYLFLKIYTINELVLPGYAFVKFFIDTRPLLLSFSEANSTFFKVFHTEQKRAAVLYRGYLWPATYDKNDDVTNVFIPYTVKTGGWFRGLGKRVMYQSKFKILRPSSYVAIIVEFNPDEFNSKSQKQLKIRR